MTHLNRTAKHSFSTKQTVKERDESIEHNKVDNKSHNEDDEDEDEDDLQNGLWEDERYFGEYGNISIHWDMLSDTKVNISIALFERLTDSFLQQRGARSTLRPFNFIKTTLKTKL